MHTVLSTKTWVWCGGTQPCEERDGDNQVTQRFFAQGFQTLASPSSLPASFYYTQDHLGSVREVLDATGTLRARYDYDAWGQRTKLSGDIEADFGFTGHLHHKQTGLIFTLYRAYDPRLGRWLSRDPIGEVGPDGPNLYGYARNQPTVRIDPDGKSTILIAGVVVTITAVGVIVAVDHFNDAFNEAHKSADKMQELYDNIDNSSSEDLEKRKCDADESRNKALNSATQGALAVPGTTYSGTVPTAVDSPSALATAWSYVTSQVINFFSN
jgi:RHS repeat-associated protein